ncbi:MAG TPA: DUF5668 domain-containing protein [Candidatus Dormibacteraeota bacterium]|nr:DUF5668 domain-containing protein [Candidatus Dormibacteraeota bacterium]
MSAPLPPGRGYSYRGLFWPAVLILIGILALLVNTNVIPADRLYRLADLWPVLLVVLGLLILMRRTGMPAPAATIAAALIVLIALAGAAAYVATGPSLGSGTLDSSQPAGGLAHADLEVDVGGANITVTGDASLGDDLYQAHINYTGRPPTVSLDHSTGQLRISQSNSGFIFTNQRFTLNLRIGTKIPWAIIVNAGGTNETMALSDVKLTSMSMNTGGSNADISLGEPSGVVPITFNGGGLTVHLHRPSDAAASVKVSGAGVSLSFDGRHHGGIGSVGDSTPTAADRYDVQISGGGCTVTMDTSG